MDNKDKSIDPATVDGAQVSCEPPLAAASGQGGRKRTPWAHHVLTLWTPDPAPARQAQNAADLSLRIEGSNIFADRTETVLCKADPDFFADLPGMAKARAIIWKAISGSSRLYWIFVTDFPENVMKMTPAAERDRVCIGLNGDATADKLAALRAISGCRRVLVIETLHDGTDYQVLVEGVDWVVVDGWGLDSVRLDLLYQIRDACLAADVRFFANWEGAQALLDECTWRQHPFADGVDMDRQALKGLEQKLPEPAARMGKACLNKKRASAPGLTAKVTARPVTAEGATDTAVVPVAATADLDGSAAPTAGQPAPQATVDAAVVPLTANSASISSATEILDEGQREQLVDATVMDEAADTPASDGNTTEAATECQPAPQADTTAQEVEVMASGESLGTDATRLRDFQSYDFVIRRMFDSWIEVGLALREINTRKLWQDGGYASWEAYCGSVVDLSKRHANRLIASAVVAIAINEVGPIGPTAESQVRALLRIKESVPQLVAVWPRAVERAGGLTPPSRVVAQVVAEYLAEQQPAVPNLTKAQRRAEALAKLGEAIRARTDWDLTEQRFTELTHLM